MLPCGRRAPSSPRHPDRRGGHITVRGRGFRELLPRLWERGVIPDYREPDGIRVGLAQALINDPELVVLDEPTDGVDPLGRRDIRNILERLRAEGAARFPAPGHRIAVEGRHHLLSVARNVQ